MPMTKARTYLEELQNGAGRVEKGLPLNPELDQALQTLRELFSRLIFNILCGNTDDHARNHAAFWDGEMLSLTPAYDICPQSHAGNEASQAILISGASRMSRIASCVDAGHHFLLSREETLAIAAYQKQIIEIAYRSLKPVPAAGGDADSSRRAS